MFRRYIILCVIMFSALTAESGKPFRAAWFSTVANIDWPSKEAVGNTQMHDEHLMEQALKECMKETGIVTIKSFCVYSGLKYKSACRFLDSLCEGDNARFKKVKQGGVILYLPLRKETGNTQ